MRSWFSSSQLHHPLSAPVLLVAVILTVYYSAMFSGIHSIDDPGIFSLYSATPMLSKILLPGNGYYYRPLVELSYWVDNSMWGMEPVAMHLENILLHCANSLLVFLLARKMSDGDVKQFPLVPLLAALLFALHPVNVEAVAWIAGRTDPLLTLFVLSASYFWLCWLDKPSWQDMAAALVFFVAALLTKETAFAFIAVIVLLTLLWPGTVTNRQRMTAAGLLVSSGIVLVLFALVFRGTTSGLSRIISGTNQHLWLGMYDVLVAVGFYARKLIVSAPLNFAITEVHAIYGLAGVALVPILLWAFCVNRRVGLLLISAMLLVLPAALVAVTQISWTPFAERYLYLPTAFCSLGFSVFIQSSWKPYRRYVIFIMLPVLAGFAFMSVQRTMLWSNKLAFFQDAVAKSPGFGSLYNELGCIMMQRGEIDRAFDLFATADRLNKRPSMRLPIKANLIGVLYAKGDFIGVRKSFFKLFKEKNEANADFLELLYMADNKRLETLAGKDKVLLAVDILETLDLLNMKRSNPFQLYRSGQISLAIGDKVKAADFFQRSYTAAPADAHYRRAALIYLRKLGSLK